MNETADVQPTPAEGASTLERLTRFLEGPEEVEVKEESAQPDADASKGQTVEAKEGPPKGESEPLQLSTADIASVLGIDESALDVDEDGGLRIKTKIDGQEGKAKLQDLLKAYQIGGHAENRARQVADAEKAIAARAQQAERLISERIEQVESLAKVAVNEMMKEYQSIDWQNLRASDPGQYAAMQQEFAQRQQQIATAVNSARQQKGQIQAQVEAARMEAVQEESKRLSDLIPDWKDANTRSKDVSAIVKAAKDRGVPEFLIDMLSNGVSVPGGFIPPSAGLVALLRDGVKYQELQSAKPTIENKVRSAPKLVKAGATQKENPQAEGKKALIEQVRKSGGRGGSFAAYLQATGRA